MYYLFSTIHRRWKVEKVGGAEHCYLRGLSLSRGSEACPPPQEIFEKYCPGD